MTTHPAGDPLWDRWGEIDPLFDRLLELDPVERESRIEEWCADDADLAHTLRVLLLASEREGTRDGTPGPTLVRAALAQAGGREIEDDGEFALPARIGPYRVLNRIGRGGMASVYLAERDDPDFPQRVALKVLRRGVDTEDAVRRFRAERQILAVLRHPNIARVFDAGATDDGRLYLVLEYVEGRSLISHCDSNRLGIEERLKLFMAVARAVAHAHERGIIHGDLKSSNILVTEEEQHVRLLDFGIARILDWAAARDDQPATRPGMRPMTPGFASPEQVLGLPVTERSDVYQLGLMLYELLAGSRPFQALPSTPGAPGSIPLSPRPLNRSVSPEVAESRSTDLKKLRRALKGDLDAIVGRALERDPERRYDTVRDLHDDIARCLEGTPATARRAAAGRRLRAHAARLGVGVAIAVAIGGAFLASGGGSQPVVSPPREVHWFAIGPISEGPGVGDPALSRQVSELLATNLARTPQIQVLALQRWIGDDTPNGRERLEEAALVAGARELLLGTLQVTPGDMLRLELVRTDLESGLTEVTYRAEGADPFALVDRVTEVLLADIGFPPPALGVASVTTSSPVAYRLYEEGLRIYYEGDYRAAYRLFTAALNEDSRFAMAAYRRALTNEKIDYASFRDDLLYATTSAGRASQRERLLIRNAWALEMDEPNQAALADSLVTLFPASPEGHLFVGLARSASGNFMASVPELRQAASMDAVLSGGGDPRCLTCDALEGLVNAYLLADSIAAAEREARRWVALRRESDRAWRTLATTLEYQGRTDEALTARNLAAAIGSENPRDGVFAAVLALREGDFTRADRLLASYTEAADPLLWQNVLWYRTLSARYQGRLEEALESAVMYRETLLEAATAGHPPIWAPLLEAVILEESGRSGEAAALWRQIASGPYEPESLSRTARHRAWTLTHAASAHAAAGDVHLLEALADTIQELGAQSAYGRDSRLHEYVRGLSLAARGETASAADAFRRSVYSLTGGYGRINLELGRALLAVGEPEEAITVLSGALRGPLDAANLYVNRTEMHRLLAEAYLAANLPDSARVHLEWVARAQRERSPASALVASSAAP